MITPRAFGGARRPLRFGVCWLAALAATLPACDRAVAASPWLEPGDVGLRHDIELLVDAGLLGVPLTVWPMSWPQIVRDLDGAEASVEITPEIRAALQRLRRRASQEGRSGTAIEWRAAASARPTELRTFESVPREEGELSGALEWLGDRFAVRLAATVAYDPDDDEALRPDGSYVGVTLGNWMLSAGYLERWWGPGWEGSNILGNNARPFLALAFDRQFADPFETRWLSWLGRWSVNGFYGLLENDRQDIDRPHFLGLRITFTPFDAVEIGLMRTAQWCGEGRNCNWDTFENLITGNENAGETVDPDEEPGNQMAGWDLRWSSPFDSGPWALYYHDIGEDESSRKPIFRLKQGGFELWGGGAEHSWRAHLEWSDSDAGCGGEGSEGCAYRGGPYQVEGYSYFERSLGHAMFYGGEMYSLGATVALSDDAQMTGLVRHVDLNQRGNGSFHTIVVEPEERWNLELSYRRTLGEGTLAIGLGADHGRRDDGSDYVTGRGFVELRQGF